MIWTYLQKKLKVKFTLPNPNLFLYRNYGEPVSDTRISKKNRQIVPDYDNDTDYHNANLKIKIENNIIYMYGATCLEQFSEMNGIFYRKYSLEGKLLDKYYTTDEDFEKLNSLYNPFGVRKSRFNIVDYNNTISIIFGYNKIYRIEVKDGKAINISTVKFGYSYEEGLKLTRNIDNLIEFSEVILKNEEVLKNYEKQTVKYFNGNTSKIWEDDNYVLIFETQRKKHTTIHSYEK